MVTFSTVLPIHSQILPGHNQETYQRLQNALQATPPHQLWIAACDDLPLQRQLAATLEESLPVHSEVTSTQLIFAVDNPDLGQQIQGWAKSLAQAKPPLLQILGIEQLTYQGSEQQYWFLRSLRSLFPIWQQLECSLLIWLPRPWLKQVKRAVPTLCQTVFEFIGEPTPLPTVTATQPHKPAFSSIQRWQFLGQLTTDTTLQSPDEQRSDMLAAMPETTPTEAKSVESEAVVSLDISEPARDVPPLPHDLWPCLPADVTQQDAQTEFLPPVPTVLPADVQQIEETGPQPTHPFTEDPGSSGADVDFQEPDPWTLAYEWRDRVQAGDQSPATLQTAIQHYENLLANELAISHRTEILNDLGSLYWLFAQQSTDADIYQQRLIYSCDLYESALAPISPGTGADILTRLHSNLGSVYSLLAEYQNSTQCLGKAVRSFHRALQYTPPETLPTEYATLQTHLGTAYWSLAQQTHEATHLHRAISAYQEALHQFQPQQMPHIYAQLQNNLGIALWSLAHHERPSFLLEQAIEAYRSALAYRTQDADPVGCAATHNNLGTAYWDLGGHCHERSPEQQQAWQQAIAAYETALQIAASMPQNSLGFDMWATHHSAGVIYDQLAIAITPDVASQQPHLLKALSHYVQALSGWHSLDADTDNALQAIVRNLCLQAQYLGVAAQQRSLSQIPAEWLPAIWRQL